MEIGPDTAYIQSSTLLSLTDTHVEPRGVVKTGGLPVSLPIKGDSLDLTPGPEKASPGGHAESSPPMLQRPVESHQDPVAGAGLLSTTLAF